jgi:hypothetical protein
MLALQRFAQSLSRKIALFFNDLRLIVGPGCGVWPRQATIGAVVEFSTRAAVGLADG